MIELLSLAELVAIVLMAWWIWRHRMYHVRAKRAWQAAGQRQAEAMAKRQASTPAPGRELYLPNRAARRSRG